MQQISGGTILRGRYRLDDKIGAGGYGSVWAARDLSGRWAEPVAVKVLGDRALGSRDARARFSREAEVLLGLEHPGIVRALDFFDGDDETPAFLVLELIEGRSLAFHIAARTRTGQHVAVGEALEVFTAIAEAVDSAHARGVVHRDLKPLNVMIVRRLARGDAPVKVLDFGLAKILHGDVVDATTLGRRLGSFLYMAPEQALAHPTDERTDVFSLGTLLFELLTLRRAWARDDLDLPLPALDGPIPFKQVNNPTDILARITRGARPRPSRSRPDLPVELDVVLGAAMAIDPAARPPTVRALLQDVERVLAARPGPLAPEPPTDLAEVPDVPARSDGLVTTLPDPAASAEHTPLSSAPLAARPGGGVSTDPQAGLLQPPEPPALLEDPELEAARLPMIESPAPRIPTAAAPELAPPTDGDPDRAQTRAVLALAPRVGPFTPTDAGVPPVAPAPRRPVGLLAALVVAATGLAAIVATRPAPPPAPRPADAAPAPAPAPTPAPSARARPAGPVEAAEPEPMEPGAPPAAGEPANAERRRPRSSASARSAAARPSPRAATARRAEADGPKRTTRLRRRLDALRRAPGDVEALERLAEDLKARARASGDEARRTRVERLVHSAVMLGDLRALERAIDLVE